MSVTGLRERYRCDSGSYRDESSPDPERSDNRQWLHQFTRREAAPRSIRWDWDLNPGSREATGFQDRRNRPLCHPTTHRDVETPGLMGIGVGRAVVPATGVAPPSCTPRDGTIRSLVFTSLIRNTRASASPTGRDRSRTPWQFGRPLVRRSRAWYITGPRRWVPSIAGTHGAPPLHSESVSSRERL